MKKVELKIKLGLQKYSGAYAKSQEVIASLAVDGKLTGTQVVGVLITEKVGGKVARYIGTLYAPGNEKPREVLDCADWDVNRRVGKYQCNMRRQARSWVHDSVWRIPSVLPASWAQYLGDDFPSSALTSHYGRVTIHTVHLLDGRVLHPTDRRHPDEERLRLRDEKWAREQERARERERVVAELVYAEGLVVKEAQTNGD